MASERSRPATVDYALFDSLKSLKQSVFAIADSNETLALENDFFQTKIAVMRRDLQQIDERKRQLADDVDERKMYAGVKEVDMLEAEMARRIEEYKTLVAEQQDLSRRIRAKEDSLAALRQQTRQTYALIGQFQQKNQVMDGVDLAEYVRRVDELDRMLRQSEESLDVQRQQKEFFRLDGSSIKNLSDAENINKELWNNMKSLEADLRSLSQGWTQSASSQAVTHEKYQRDLAGFEQELSVLEREKKDLRFTHDEAQVALQAFSVIDDENIKLYRDQLDRENQELRRRAADLRIGLKD